jgi:hypothetical protein
MFVTMLDPTAARAVAAAHDDAPRVGDAQAEAAYARLVHESDQLFRRLVSSRWPVRVTFTMSEQPYASADELITSIRRDRVAEISSAAREHDRRHPSMGCELGGEYDRFRAVHDVLGHGRLGAGFDRDGEYATWRFQERFHSPLARRALATELHAEHSVRWTTGELAEHKAVLLDERAITRSRVGRRDWRPDVIDTYPRTFDDRAAIAAMHADGRAPGTVDARTANR